MKSFTAKEFSRCPAKVYEAAREDGSVEITHDRFGGRFLIIHLAKDSYDHKWNGEFNNLLGHKNAADIKYDDGVQFFSRGFVCRVLDKGGTKETIDSESKVGDIAHTNGYRVLLIEKAPD